jgi:hypothetical protein
MGWMQNGRDVTPSPTAFINGCFSVYFCEFSVEMVIGGGRDATGGGLASTHARHGDDGRGDILFGTL